MTQILGVAGFARSGKDTFADYLVTKGWQKWAIAEPIKWLAIAGHPRVERVVADHGWEFAKRALWVRPLLQNIGATIRSEFGDVFLIDLLFEKVDDSGLEAPVVVSDVRTQAEIDYIRRRGGKTVRIVRNGVGPANGDVTERYLQCDYELLNDGTTVEQLHESIDNFLLFISD